MKTLKNCFIVTALTVTLIAFTNTGFASGTKLPGSGLQPASDTVIVPDNVRVTFQAKYPQATNVAWYKYEDMKDEYTDTYPDFYDPANYYVVYRNDNVDYVSWYSPAGEWVMTTNTITSDKLPPAALKTLQDSYNGYTIVKVDEDHYSGGIRYDVKMTKGDEKLKVHITADGQILKLKDKQ